MGWNHQLVIIEQWSQFELCLGPRLRPSAVRVLVQIHVIIDIRDNEDLDWRQKYSSLYLWAVRDTQLGALVGASLPIA